MNDLLARVRNAHSLSSAPMSLLLGVDEFFKDLDEMVSRTNSTIKSGGGGYPPFNIKRKDNEYMIELALAGFSRDEINISLTPEKNILVISGEAGAIEDEVVSLSHKERMKLLSGVANRSDVDLDAAAESVKSDNPGGFAKADEPGGEKDEWTVLYKGIAKRRFKQEFKLPRAAEVKGAKMVDGLLTVSIELPLPEKKEAVSIEIE